MTYVDYVEIENFKGLERNIRIELGNPSVIIGPNNAGKTTVLQALSLWSRAVKAWLERKGSGHSKGKHDGVGINRLLIMDIPVKETRYFWSNAKIGAKRQYIHFSVEVGVRMSEGRVTPLKMVFSYRDSQILYARPDDRCMGNTELLDKARNLEFNLLYPMSGLSSGTETAEERLLQPGSINVLLGQGQTAQVLRNLCYAVQTRSADDWNRICEIANVMFGFELRVPRYDETRGTLSVSYRQPGTDVDLELVLAGRGVHQMLLILAYLYSHRGSVLMIDEPDAHLEILRQKQVLVVLKDVADETRCQIVIATHSEVILDEAESTNLTCVVNGTASELSSKADVKMTLKSLGVQHYYKALVAKRLLITEGSTDVEMLRAFARKIGHPAKNLLESPFTFYMQDVDPDEDSLDRLGKVETRGINYQQYFHALKGLVPELRAIAFRDGDGKNHANEASQKDLKTFFWERYELENYFITPKRLADFVREEIGEREGELFAVTPECQKNIEKSIDDALAQCFFGGDAKKVASFHQSPPDMQGAFLDGKKMSAFAEVFFERFSRLHKCPVLLNKGGYCRLIAGMDARDVPVEIVDRLDSIVEVLSPE